MRLKDKSALITGAAGGFGKAIGQVFAREGAAVTLMDINGDNVASVASQIGGKAVMGDVTQFADIKKAVEIAQTHGGGLHIVVNNAGTTHRNKPMLEVSEEEYDRVFDINVRSIFHMTHAAVPVMRAQGSGNIINIGSTAGIRPRPGLLWYNATKGAVNLLSKSMALELAPDNIRVNCIAPVMGKTGLLEEFMGLPDTPENREKFIATIPLGRMSDPMDIAHACLFLASDEAALITGSVMEVDGGRTV